MSASSKPPAGAEEILVFPQQFPLKIMGRNVPELQALVCTLILQYAPDFDISALTARESAKGNYVALTCTINATSRGQLDDIYNALSKHPLVAYML